MINFLFILKFSITLNHAFQHPNIQIQTLQLQEVKVKTNNKSMNEYRRSQRCNTSSQDINERRSCDNYKAGKSSQQNVHSRNLYTQNHDSGPDMFFELMNSQNDIKSNQQTDFKEENSAEIKQLRLPNRIKYLMKRLKQLIKQLCLTRHAVIEVDEELDKITQFIKDTFSATQKFTSYHSEFRTTNYEILEKSVSHIHYDTNQPPCSKYFSKFLEGTVYQNDSSARKSKLNTYQQELLQEFMDKYILLLQKQINRISKYNGEKKLKYLLQTVMKQIFVQIMRFTYETKIEIFKQTKKNRLNLPSTKVSMLVETLKRIFESHTHVRFAFKSIRKSVRSQNKADADFVNNFQVRINLLDNFIKIKERKQIRERFLQWRKTSILSKKLQQEEIFNCVNLMIRQILYQFAKNEGKLQKWKFIIWSKMNDFIKNVCKFGETILFPLQDNEIEEQFSLRSSLISSKRQSGRVIHQESESYRYSVPSSEGYQQSVENQKGIMEEIDETFSTQEKKLCLRNGQIIMNHNQSVNIMLIPVKCVSGIIGVRYSKPSSNQTIRFNNQQGQINVNRVYNILTALQSSSPMILELMQLKQNFKYFSQKIQEQSYHKFILSNALQLRDSVIDQKQTQIIQQNKMISKKLYSINSQAPSITHRSARNECKITFQQKLQYIDECLYRIKIEKFFVYHKANEKSYQSCLEYAVGQNLFKCEKVIGKDIIEAIFTQLEKINKPQEKLNGEIPKLLLLKKNNLTFYAHPLIKNGNLIGFVQIHMSQHFNQHYQSNNYKSYNQNSYFVTPIDVKNQKLNENMIFLIQGFIPSFVQINNKNDNKYVKIQKSKCQFCQFYTNQSTCQNFEAQKYALESKHSISFSIQDLNNIFLKYQKCQDKKQRMLVMEKQIFQMAKQSIKSQKQPKSDKNYVFPLQLNLESIEQQLFMRLFYLKNPRTKDNKTYFSIPKESKNSSRFTFSELNAQISESDTTTQQIQLKFIDELKLFQNKQQKQPQSFKISLSKLIDAYKSIIRKSKSRKNHQTVNPNKKMDLTQKQSTQIFLQELIKSTLFNQEIEELQSDKKFHQIQLLLYQLQDYNKREDEQKISFHICLYPIFTLLDGKNRYLAGLMSMGKFRIHNQDGKQIQNSNTRFKFNSNKMNNVSQFIEKINNQVLGKIIELNIKKQAEEKEDLQEKSIKKLFNDERIINFQDIIQCQKQLSCIQNKGLSIYGRGSKLIQKFNLAITMLQSQLILMKKHKIKSSAITAFSSNLKLRKNRLLNQMTNILQTKIVSRNMNTNRQMFSQFMKRLQRYNLSKSEHYLKYSLLFQQKMTSVFVINKLFKAVFEALKILTFEEGCKIEDANTGLTLNLQISKKFALQRLLKIMKSKLFQKQTHSQKSSQIHFAFQAILQFSIVNKTLQKSLRDQSAYTLKYTMQKLICKKCYTPYFSQLQVLERSLSENVSLIGSQIQSMSFYSFFQFLRFLNERISIIIKAEKRLISILYSKVIQKINVFMIIEDQKTNQSHLLAFSEKETGKLILEKLPFQDKINSNICTKIKASESSESKIYLGFEFIEENCEEKEKYKNSLKNFASIIKKVFEQNIANSFDKFYALYQKKIKGFALKVSKVLKIRNNASIKANNQNIAEEQVAIKKYVLKKLENEFIKCQKFYKTKQLIKESDRKSKQLEQLQSLYGERSKLLLSAQTDTQRQSPNIITKGMIRSLKQNIQNLDINSQSLSIQYQIKSKTVSGYQIMSFINNSQKREAMEHVALSLMTSLNHKQMGAVSDDKIDSSSGRNCPNYCLTDDILMQQKQKVNYLRAFCNQEQNFYSQKFKKTGIRSISKILNNITKSAFKRSFYQINSFSRLNQPLQKFR